VLREYPHLSAGFFFIYFLATAIEKRAGREFPDNCFLDIESLQGLIWAAVWGTTLKTALQNHLCMLFHTYPGLVHG
jgi:hypothetical protein